MQSWGPHTQSFEAVNMNFGYFGQHISSKKKHYGYFFKPPSGQAPGSRRCWKMHLRPWHPEFWSWKREFWVLWSAYHLYEKILSLHFDTTFRASFRLNKVLENAVPKALVSRVFKLLIKFLGILIPPSGQASGSKSCWKMQSQGLGIQSYQAINMNFWYFFNIPALTKPTWSNF